MKNISVLAIIAFFLTSFSLNSNSDTTNPNIIEIIRNSGLPPLEYVPFSESELIALSEEPRYEFWLKIHLNESGEKVVIFLNEESEEIHKQLVSQFISDLNATEQVITPYGFSLRQEGEDALAIWELFNDPEMLRKQLLNALEIAAKEEVLKIIDAIPQNECPQIDIDSLQDKIILANKQLEQVEKSGFSNVKLELPNGEVLRIREVVNNTNNTIKVACTVGILMTEYMPLFTLDGSTKSNDGIDFPTISLAYPISLENFGKAIMEAFQNALPSLGLDVDLSNYSLFGLSKMFKFNNMSPNEWEDFLSKNLSFPAFDSLKLKIAELEGQVGQIDIPSIPNIPSPVPPSHPELKLSKRKDWGFHSGNNDTLSAYSTAYYELKGSEKGQAATAFGAAGVYVFGEEINAVGGFLDLSAKPTKLNAQVLVQYLGHVVQDEENKTDSFVVGNKLIDEKYESSKSISYNGNLYKFQNSVGYTQVFMVGPIPVYVEAGASFNLGVDAIYGVNFLKAYGSIIPEASALAFASGSAGIKKILEAGARAELHIIKASIPLEGAAEMRFSEYGEPYLDLSLRSDANLKYLDGRIYAYAKYIVPRWGLPPYKTKKATKDIFKWHGVENNRAIMDWGLRIGYEGTQLRGSLIDSSDRKESESLGDAITLIERAHDLGVYRENTIIRLDTLAADITTKLQHNNTNNVAIESAKIEHISTVIDDKITDYHNQLCDISNKATCI